MNRAAQIDAAWSNLWDSAYRPSEHPVGSVQWHHLIALRDAFALPPDAPAPVPMAMPEVLRELRDELSRKLVSSVHLCDVIDAIDSAAAKCASAVPVNSKPFQPGPCMYHLDHGVTVPAVRYGTTFDANSLLFVDLNHPNGRDYVGKPDWWDRNYVVQWGGIVQECATEGTEPGQWSRYPEGSKPWIPDAVQPQPQPVGREELREQIAKVVTDYRGYLAVDAADRILALLPAQDDKLRKLRQTILDGPRNSVIKGCGLLPVPAHEVVNEIDRLLAEPSEPDYPYVYSDAARSQARQSEPALPTQEQVNAQVEQVKQDHHKAAEMVQKHQPAPAAPDDDAGTRGTVAVKHERKVLFTGKDTQYRTAVQMEALLIRVNKNGLEHGTKCASVWKRDAEACNCGAGNLMGEIVELLDSSEGRW